MSDRNTLTPPTDGQQDAARTRAALVEFVRALARQQAAQDYEEMMAHEARRDLRTV